MTTTISLAFAEHERSHLFVRGCRGDLDSHAMHLIWALRCARAPRCCGEKPRDVGAWGIPHDGFFDQVAPLLSNAGHLVAPNNEHH